MSMRLGAFAACFLATSAWATDWTQYAAGEPVSLPSGDYTVTDEDFATFNALGRVELASDDSVLTFDLVGEKTLTHAVYGLGKIVKANVGTLVFTAVQDTETMTDGKNVPGKVDGAWADFYTKAGLEIAGGTVKCPQDGTGDYRYGHVVMAEGTVLYLIPGTASVASKALVESLNGYGMITNTTPNGAQQKCSLQIGYSPNSNTKSSYYGVIGGNMYLRTDTLVELWNENNTFTGNVQPVRNDDSAAHLWDRGILAVAKFGKKGEPSSLGLDGGPQARYSAGYRYLGTGEETDRGIYVINANYGSKQPTIIDAGVHGGLTFMGDQIYSNWDYHGHFLFTGSNTVPCTIACGMSTPGANGVTWVNIKDGTGTWRLADHACRTNTGPWVVREGTLQFESIAEVGETCSLGWSSRLFDFPTTIYSKDVSDTYKVDYSVLLGGVNPNFEFVGSNRCATTTRKVALTGEVARITFSPERSPACEVVLTNSATKSASEIASHRILGELNLLGGVYAKDAGTRTLVLDGAAGEAAGVIGEIKDSLDPEAKDRTVNVRKVGTGTWKLKGDLSFSGELDVRNGTVEVVTDEKYKWYRFTVTKVGNGHAVGEPCSKWGLYLYMAALGLFGADGTPYRPVMRDAVPVGALDSAGNASFKYPKDFWQHLEPGQITVGDATGLSQYRTYPARMPSVAIQTWSLYQTYCASSIGASGAASYLPLVFRLPEDAPEICYYDVCQSQSSVTEGNGHVATFMLEASVDGCRWDKLHSLDKCMDRASGQWMSTGITKTNYQNCVTHHFGFPIAGHVSSADAKLAKVSGVKVAKGATLKTSGTVTLPAITIDCAGDGLGTIDGFSFGEEGTVNLENLPKGDKTLSASFVNCKDLANANFWTVKVGGAVKTTREVVFSDTGVTVRAKGLTLIIR